jgi:hypothetical protein
MWFICISYKEQTWSKRAALFLKGFVYVVPCYPVGHLAHYPCELQGGELTVFEHCDHLCFVELVFLELEDYKVLGVGDYPPAGCFTFLD